ncbi:DUF6521 family protein [Subsaxibacter sp. CAU 1640]|uniref:three component ABC system middle component n=1 Tax=Subsaxibacter sp. CAU 1640 TaxID=2933271 RepID=UPI0020056470|nr:three component ABC system middle component [Subsaxibacter sp. CAU 1640]MCK7590075.1 DUF6521 family protein [Subsaxibacter sp. CAU 1640]
MKEVYYVYNNEAIASCVFLSILQEIKEIDIARISLMLPFLLDDRTVNFLNRLGLESDLNLEQIIKEQPRLFVSFNQRYLSLLPVMINSLIILEKSNQIKIKKLIKVHSEFKIENTDNLGARFSNINRAIPQLLAIIKSYDTSKLYKTLNIQL